MNTRNQHQQDVQEQAIIQRDSKGVGKMKQALYYGVGVALGYLVYLLQ